MIICFERVEAEQYRHTGTCQSDPAAEGKGCILNYKDMVNINGSL
jgi:hypothetical protein